MKIDEFAKLMKKPFNKNAYNEWGRKFCDQQIKELKNRIKAFEQLKQQYK